MIFDVLRPPPLSARAPPGRHSMTGSKCRALRAERKPEGQAPETPLRFLLATQVLPSGGYTASTVLPLRRSNGVYTQHTAFPVLLSLIGSRMRSMRMSARSVRGALRESPVSPRRLLSSDTTERMNYFTAVNDAMRVALKTDETAVVFGEV